MPKVKAMVGRLLIGMLKGVILGAALGFGMIQLGWAVPGTVVAYLAAAVTGVLIGLIAGKPIWAKDARIEAGMKAGVGAILALVLTYATRRWLTTPVPQPLLDITKSTVASGTTATLGTYGMTALAAVAAVLGGFYDADNTPEADKPDAKGDSAPAGKARIAEPEESDESLEDVESGESDDEKKQAK